MTEAKIGTNTGPQRVDNSPHGYHRTWRNNEDLSPLLRPWLVSGNIYNNHKKDEYFLLTNRSFEEIDRYLNYLLSEIIINFPKQPGRPLYVLDVPGGELARAAKDLAHNYKGLVAPLSLDLITAVQIPSPGLAIRGDANKLPILSNSIDLIYSYQFFPYIVDDQKKSQKVEFLKEMGRVLRLGGAAVIFDDLDNLSKLSEVVSQDGSIEIASRGTDNQKVHLLTKGPRSPFLQKLAWDIVYRDFMVVR